MKENKANNTVNFSEQVKKRYIAETVESAVRNAIINSLIQISIEINETMKTLSKSPNNADKTIRKALQILFEDSPATALALSHELKLHSQNLATITKVISDECSKYTKFTSEDKAEAEKIFQEWGKAKENSFCDQFLMEWAQNGPLGIDEEE